MTKISSSTIKPAILFSKLNCNLKVLTKTLFFCVFRMIKNNGGTAYAYTVDLCSREKIYEAAKQLKQEVGSVKILVNNAGIVSGSTVLDTPDEKIIRTFDVNVLAHFWTMKAFMPDMINNKKGHIVNVASLAGYSGSNKLVDYCSSKFAALGIDDALKVELMAQGHDYIKTTVVCPYYISTGMFAGVNSKVCLNYIIPTKR